MDRRTSWATVHGVTRSQTWLSTNTGQPLVLDLIMHSPKGTKGALTQGSDTQALNTPGRSSPGCKPTERPTWEVREWIRTCSKPTGIREHLYLSCHFSQPLSSSYPAVPEENTVTLQAPAPCLLCFEPSGAGTAWRPEAILSAAHQKPQVKRVLRFTRRCRGTHLRKQSPVPEGLWAG